MQIVLLVVAVIVIAGYVWHENKGKWETTHSGHVGRVLLNKLRSVFLGEDDQSTIYCEPERDDEKQTPDYRDVPDENLMIICKLDPDNYEHIVDSTTIKEVRSEVTLGRGSGADYQLTGDDTVSQIHAAIVKEQTARGTAYYFEHRSQTNPSLYFDTGKFKWIELKRGQKRRLEGRQLFELGEVTKIIVIMEQGCTREAGTKTAMLYNQQLRQASETVWIPRSQRK